MKPGAADHRSLSIWTAATDDVPPECWAASAHWLDETERARQAKLRVQADRISYGAAHALLHWAIERVAGLGIDRQIFTANEFGRPQLAPIDDRIGSLPSFSLSHARGLVAVAIGPCLSIGVDVEIVGNRAVDTVRLARSVFAPREAAWVLQADSPAMRLERLLQVWTLKEALVKAVGRGLGLAFDSFLVQVDPPQLELGTPDLEATGRWRLEQWRPDARSWVALAVDESIEHPLELRRHHLTGEALLAALQTRR